MPYVFSVFYYGIRRKIGKEKSDHEVQGTRYMAKEFGIF